LDIGIYLEFGAWNLEFIDYRIEAPRSKLQGMCSLLQFTFSFPPVYDVCDKSVASGA
jgi:hypothetical protein